MCKIVMWEGIHVSALHSQTVSNDILLSGHTGTVPVSEVAVGDSLWSRNRPTLNLYRKKKLVRLLVSLFSAFYFFKVSYISYTMPRSCVNNPDNFCYICREVTFPTRKCPLTPMVKKAYECDFGCKVRDQDKKWAPHVCCISCATTLCDWLNNKGHSMPLAFP